MIEDPSPAVVAGVIVFCVALAIWLAILYLRS